MLRTDLVRIHGVAAMRAAVTGMALVLRPRHPLKIFVKLADLARWLPSLAPQYSNADVEAEITKMREQHGTRR